MRYLILLISSAFVACGGGATDDYSASEEVEEAAENIGATFHDSLDAAEEVEDVLLDAKKARDEAIEDAQ